MEATIKRYSIGVDIGATKVNIGIVDQTGKIYEKQRFVTGNKPSADDVLQKIIKSVNLCVAKMGIDYDDIDFLGIGVPGTIDMERKNVVFAPNLNWRDLKIVNIMEQHYPFKMILEQDAKAAAIGELLIGAGTGLDDIVCLTLGSGIGCGIVINRKIFRGKLNTAGEVGHILIDINGPACNCGKFGCLEAYASGMGLSKAVTEEFSREISSEDLFKLAKRDDKAKKVVSAGVEALGIGIVNIINILSPQAIILCGGLAEQELYVQQVKDFVFKYAYEVSIQPDKFVFCKAKLGADAPMVGAALLDQI